MAITIAATLCLDKVNLKSECPTHCGQKKVISQTIFIIVRMIFTGYPSCAAFFEQNLIKIKNRPGIEFIISSPRGQTPVAVVIDSWGGEGFELNVKWIKQFID